MANSFLEKLATMTATASTSASSASANADRPQADIWINFGKIVGYDAENQPIIITLPSNIPLDTMKDAEASPNSTKDFIQRIQGQNYFKNELLHFSKDLKAGERIVMPLKDLPALCVVIQRRKAPTVVSANEANPYLTSFMQAPVAPVANPAPAVTVTPATH